MSIKIGEQTLATRRPSDLAAALIATSGCNAAELASQLTAGGTPFQAARALHPFLTGDAAMPVGDLAALIAAGDPAQVRRDVVALLVPADGKPAPVPAA